MDSSGIYDLLLVIHSNHGPILYHLQDEARYWPKTVIFFQHKFISGPHSGITFKFYNGILVRLPG